MAVACAVAGFVGARDARAEPAVPAPNVEEDDAKALYLEGARLYDVGRYDEAVAHFQRAYLITGAPTLLLNIGQAQRLAGACSLSAASYRRYLEKAPDARHRSEVERRVQEMDACVANARSAPVEVTAQPEPPSGPPTKPEPDEASLSPSWRVLGWGGVGIGAAGVAIGAVGLGLTLDAQASLDRVCASNGACPRTAERELDAYERWRWVAATGAVITVAGAAAALVGFLMSHRGGSSSSSRGALQAPDALALTPWLVVSSAGLRGTFR